MESPNQYLSPEPSFARIARFGNFGIGCVRINELALKLQIWFRDLLNGLVGLSGRRRGTSGTALTIRHVSCG